jgi:hypothetical protein
MKIQYIKALWGMNPITDYRAHFPVIAEAGYDGVEAGLPNVSPEEWADLMAQYNLCGIMQLYPFTIEQAEENIRQAVKYNPISITIHSGRDSMTFEEGCRFIQHCLNLEEELGVPIAHETHRGRLLYAPWVTAAYLEKFEKLRLCSDFSHWCVVSESLLEHVPEQVELAISRTIHVHGRVGYQEGPQVPDPSAPEYAAALAAHEAWWDRMLKARKESGAESLTFCPEFGPPPYLHTLPHTNQPVADLWSVCLWMTKRQKERWGTNA